MARQFFFFWPAPKKVCPSLVDTMMHGQKNIKHSILASFTREMRTWNTTFWVK